MSVRWSGGISREIIKSIGIKGAPCTAQACRTPGWRLCSSPIMGRYWRVESSFFCFSKKIFFIFPKIIYQPNIHFYVLNWKIEGFGKMFIYPPMFPLTAAIASHPARDRIKLISPRKASQQARAGIINQILIQSENFGKWIMLLLFITGVWLGELGVKVAV